MAQDNEQKFNLDFNKIIPGNPLPKGWIKWGFYESTGFEKVDSMNVAGKLSWDKKGKFGSMAYRIPARYKGDSITLSGYMKMEGVKKGFAGLLLRLDGYGGSGSLGFDNMRRENIQGTRDWAPYKITMPFPDRTENIMVAGILTGRGTAWFDDFKVTIDGKDIQYLEEVGKNRLDSLNFGPMIGLLKKEIKPLRLNDNKELSNSLDALVSDIGDKRIVALGESTHGTSEFYTLRTALTKKLILEKGFNTVVLENPYDDIELLNKKFLEEPLESLMEEHLFSIYQTREMYDFLNWLKTSGNYKKVAFKGFDDSYWVLLELLEEEFENKSNPRIRQEFELLKKGFAAYSRAKPKKKRKTGKELNTALATFEKTLEEEQVLTDRRKELLLNAKTTYINYAHLANGQPIESRDAVMAQRIAFLANDPKSKVVVWGHNAHVSKSIVDGDIGQMGNTLKKELEDDYFVVGMATLSGTYSYMEERFINGDHDYGETLKTGKILPARKFSWESLLGGLGENPFYVDLQKVKWKNGDRERLGALKLLGYRKETRRDFHLSSPLRMYDALFFVKNTKATRPLSSK